jgi:hypothetical protein
MSPDKAREVTVEADDLLEQAEKALLYLEANLADLLNGRRTVME